MTKDDSRWHDLEKHLPLWSQKYIQDISKMKSPELIQLAKDSYPSERSIKIGINVRFC
jgi:hypothetical protein